MISEFHQLSEKIDQLAALAHSLRRENADLRIYTAALVAENTAISKRMEEAHRRVSALMDKIPLSEQDSEQDEATA